MKYFKKFVLIIILFTLLLSICFSSFATSDDIASISMDDDNTLNEEIQSINSDLYSINSDITYNLGKTLLGNAFIVCDDFSTSVSEAISGDLYVIANTITLKSDVSYSNEKDKQGNLSISTVNSSTCVSGNVFAIAKDFVIEPGVEIDGNLYLISQKATLASQSKIYGNAYICSDNITFNSQIGNSMYVTSKNFNLGYYGFIYRDLNLYSENCKLDGGVYRNANINSENITLKDNFLVHGNFDYCSKAELQFKDNMIIGNINYSDYSQNQLSPKEIILDCIIYIVSFVVYIFISFIIIQYVSKNYIEKEFSMTVKNVLIAFGIGLLTCLGITFITLALLFTGIGYMLSLALLATFAFVLAISTPLFIIDIAKMFKKNLLWCVPVVSGIIGLISLIPFVGFIFMSLLTLISIGSFILEIFKK